MSRCLSAFEKTSLFVRSRPYIESDSFPHQCSQSSQVVRGRTTWAIAGCLNVEDQHWEEPTSNTGGVSAWHGN